MNTKTKEANYTPEQEAKLIFAYGAVSEKTYDDQQKVVQTLAAELGKPVRSIRSKLTNLGIYKKAKAVSKVTGEAPAKKGELAARLVALVDNPRATVAGLEKANKLDLDAVADCIEALKAENRLLLDVCQFEGIDPVETAKSMAEEFEAAKVAADQEAANVEADNS